MARIQPNAQETPDPIDCGFGMVAKAALTAAAIAIPILAAGGWGMYSERQEINERGQVIMARLGAHDRLVTAPAGAVLPVETASHGRELFSNTCAACHKADGTGLEGLGKDLTKSWFVASLDDEGLLAFVNAGRAPNDPMNTTKVQMPAKGGHEELSQADLKDILTYVRGLQDPRRMPALPDATAALNAPVSDTEKAKALAAAGGDADLAEFIAHGTRVYASTCIACHGPDAKGLPNLGKDLVHSEFVKKLDDDALLAFIKRGRDPGDPLNTTKILMPPKGGNPALSDDDLLDVIAYVRSLQKQAVAMK
jgi:disulfide bond formation protein DsbB